MSNFVEQITDGLNTTISTALPSYTELKYVYDLEKNDFKNNKDRYGVTVGPAAADISITKHYTVAHAFNVVLTTGYVNIHSDENLRSKIDGLYDKMDDVLKQSFQSKLGLPGVVLNTVLEGYEEPEIIEEHDVVALTMTLTISYRNQIA